MSGKGLGGIKGRVKYGESKDWDLYCLPLDK